MAKTKCSKQLVSTRYAAPVVKCVFRLKKYKVVAIRRSKQGATYARVACVPLNAEKNLLYEVVNPMRQ